MNRRGSPREAVPAPLVRKNINFRMCGKQGTYRFLTFYVWQTKGLFYGMGQWPKLPGFERVTGMAFVESRKYGK